MYKILLIASLLFTGCCKEESEVKTETVKIRQGCYYYLTDAKMTVYDIYCTNADINSNGIINVSYIKETETVNIISLTDD
jgi:hypothetical protein